jgi:hypothetical protein
VLARVVHGEYVRVVESAEKLGFLTESSHPVVIAADFLEDYLDGDLAFQRGMKRFIDLGRTPTT